jgi:hypothetical protein
MRIGGVILCMLVVCLPLAAEELLYRSNEAGVLLEPIPGWRRDEYDWVAIVRQEGPSLVRRLYERGKESRRWESSPVEGGERREERDFLAEALVSRRVYAADGAMVSEESYRDGALIEKSVSSYAGSRLLRTRTVGPDGKELHSEEYLYTRSGRLREVRRVSVDGQAGDSRFFSGSSGLAQERNAVGSALFIARYDTRGHVVSRERREADELVSREDFIFRPDSDALLSSVERLPREGRTSRRQYDEKGRLLLENVSGPGNTSERIDYIWDENDRASAKKRHSAAGLEEWAYRYDAEGGLVREDYSRRGALEKVTLYSGKNSRVEELYADGEMFLRVSWEGERRVKEEVFEQGTLVRERILE